MMKSSYDWPILLSADCFLNILCMERDSGDREIGRVTPTDEVLYLRFEMGTQGYPNGLFEFLPRVADR